MSVSVDAVKPSAIFRPVHFLRWLGGCPTYGLTVPF